MHYYLHNSITKASIKRIASLSEWLLKYKLKALYPINPDAQDARYNIQV